MKIDKKFFFGMILVFAILFLQFISAEIISNVQTSPFNKEDTKSLDVSLCQEGKDFLVQISPFGCTPAVVRTDLLEEQDVQVYCQLGATQINPLIDVQTIDSVSFSGTYPGAVSGIGFHSAKAALGVKGDLNSPVLNNIGYVVINLKKQQNASAIPDFVEGNLTAKIKYNIKNALGIGSASLYLPELSEDDWDAKRYQYNFWNGKGTLKAESVDVNSAQISVYSKEQRISSVNLQKGATSNMIYLPGFECQAGLKLRLDGLENPNTRAVLKVNAEVAEVAEGEKFLENKCSVRNLQYRGINQKVSVRCIEDDKTSEFDLSINPKITLNINGVENEYSVGDRLYDTIDASILDFYLGAGSVYLGYIGTTGDSRNPEDLFAYFVFSPEKKSRLSEEDISSISFIVGDLREAGQTSTGYVDVANDVIKKSLGLLNSLGRAIETGESFQRLNFGETQSVFEEADVSIVNFAGAQDVELTGNAKEYYENAKADYETIREGYSSETYTKDATSTFGEEAFYNEILLAWNANQKKTAYDLCSEYIQTYPNSKKDLSYCRDAIRLANQNVQEVYATINGEIKTISFEGINEPTFSDYGATVRINAPDGTVRSFDLRKNAIVYLNKSLEVGDYLQLNAVDENSANIKTNLHVYGLSEEIAKEFTGGIVTLNKDVPKDLGAGYVFTLTNINLKKIAKVSVLPNINNAGTEADFSFKIGIEKRAINLPPEQIRNIITNLNKTINDWEGISAGLGNVTQGLQAGCLAAGATLVAKNFLFGMGGAGIARQTIMRGSNGWTERCTGLVASGTYNSQDQCYLANAGKIDADVNTVSQIIEEQNNKIKQLESGITTQEFLSENVVNTSAFMQKYIPEVNECLGSQNFADPSGKGEAISGTDLEAISYENWMNKKFFNQEQLREIELYCSILKSSTANEELKQIASQRIYSGLFDIKTNVGNSIEINTLANSLGVASDDITFIETGENVRKFSYNGLVNGNRFSGLNSDALISIVATSDGKRYVMVLDDSSGTQQLPVKRDEAGLMIFNLSQERISDSDIPSELSNIYFQRFDATSYQNEYKNAELRYYETEPYKGLPAIIPFDLKNGWYAATKQTLPVGGNIQPFDASSRPNSFYLCNIGANGLEEFQTIGDDTCEMINLGTGMSYSQFPGLDDSESKNQINKAVQAITQASRIYKSGLSGKVNILGINIDVGSPAADIPQFQCQDFMSPTDCLVMFNLCDPVICPSSRCDLGGAYPVRDVVQTGVIGSLVLCLPNIQEGIIVPVCLTGVKAGVDGLLSVLTSYKDCLQESLDTGKVVGICDEIYSIYLCDFFWKQTLPLTDIVIPKVVEFLFGQTAKGGGEYAGVESSWNLAEKSINYFTNYYGASAKSAFLARTTETVKNEVCKSYASAVVSTGADFINQITTPASPVQFTGRFDEIPLTTATVPPTSHYKVFYHIFAGKDSGAYYQVYLKGSTASSYYQDASQNLAIASGYIAVGSYATETKDLTAVSGYNQLCINVNGQEECGFKEVSTDFAVNYLKDQYLVSQASETDVKTEAECISGSASIYNVLSPNIQAGVEEAINPAIYDRGITRICATKNPGLGTDPYAETENSRWKEVGYCDDENIKCWIDSESIKEVIKTTTVEGEALEEVSGNYVDILKNEGDYLSDKDFSSSVQEIEKEEDSAKKITLVENIFDKTFWSKEKVQLIFLRGNAYMELLKLMIGTQPKPESTTMDVQGMTREEILEISDAGARMVEAAKTLSGTIVPGTDSKRGYDFNDNCWTAVIYAYSFAEASQKPCGYADVDGKTYTFKNEHTGGETVTVTIGTTKRSGVIVADGVSSGVCTLDSKTSSEEKLEKIQPGYLLSILWNEEWGHNIIFLKWINKDKKIAQVFDWNAKIISLGEKDKNGNTCTTKDVMGTTSKYCKVYRIYEVDLSDNANPVFMYWAPYVPSATIPSSTPEVPKQTFAPPTVTNTDGEATTAPTALTSATIGGKIYESARNIANDLTSPENKESAAKFVGRCLINAGISGIEVKAFGSDELVTPVSIFQLIPIIESKSEFSEVNIHDLKIGDIVRIGKGCQADYLTGIGIVALVPDSEERVYVYTNLNDNEVKLENLNLFSSISGSNIYVYRAYRYVGDLSDAEKAEIVPARTRWTIDTALNKISFNTIDEVALTGSYSKNKQFVDELIVDGILTAQECTEVRGGLFGFGQKDMNWVKTKLLEKQASSGQAESQIID